jgi:hypothetical protein
MPNRARFGKKVRRGHGVAAGAAQGAPRAGHTKNLVQRDRRAGRRAPARLHSPRDGPI